MFLMVATSFAQAPNKMSYQAVVRDASDELLISKLIGVQISILQGGAQGTSVYTETFAPTTNANGLVTLELGTGIVVSGDITTIDWNNGPYFMKTETDPTGGIAYSISGTSQLMSVPYSMQAQRAVLADSIVGGATENDPIFMASPAGSITVGDKTNWDNKLDSEVDGSVTNEIQKLSISNDTIYLSDGGFVTLTNLSTWIKKSSDIYFETGNVAVGHDTPEQPLHIYDSITHGKSGSYENGLLVQSRVINSNANSHYSGIFSEVKGTDAYNTSVDGTSDGVSTGINYGLGGYARNAATNVGVEAFADGTNQKNFGLDGYAWNGFENYGVKGFAKANTDTANKHVGVHASVEAKNGLGTALWAKSTGTRPGNAIYAEAINDSSNVGIDGFARSSSTNNFDQYGVKGTAEGAAAAGTGTHYGLYGTASGAGFNNIGTYGFAKSSNSTANSANRGVYGEASSTSATYNQGMLGIAIPNRTSTTGYNAGVLGEAAGHSALNYGFVSLCYGKGKLNYGSADFVYQQNTGGLKKNIATYGYASGADTNIAIRGNAKEDAGAVNYGVYSEAAGLTGSLAGRFLGNVRVEGNLDVTGSISKGSGTFKIDHPDDPENKFLVHSFVESPDMMNIYNGNATTDANGLVTVELPDYAKNTNKDYRYQLTPIGQFAQCIIKEKVSGNKFVIQTDKPNVEVSWMITGIRNDPYANQNRIVPVVDKDQNEKGKYLHPEAYGKDDSYNIYKPLELGDAKEELEMLKKSSAGRNVAGGK